MSRAFFEELEDALVGFLPPELARFSSKRSGINLKVWYGEEREHYEVQVLWRDEQGLEIGWHAEHRDAARNERALAGLPKWRRALGPKPEAGAFVGGAPAKWRRVSEVWPLTPLEPELAIEAAERLARYIVTMERP